LVALLLNIIGGVYAKPGNSRVNKGYTLQTAGNALFLVAALLILGFTVFLYSLSNSRAQKRDPQIVQVFIVLPIVVVRTVYSTAQSAISNPSNPGHNTWVWLCLLLIPELASVTIYTSFGLTLPGRKSAQQYDTGNRLESDLNGEEKMRVRERVQ
jgi:hypothetical protein